MQVGQKTVPLLTCLPTFYITKPWGVLVEQNQLPVGEKFTFFFFLRFYLFINERHTWRGGERETETQAEGEAGSMQGA